MTATCVNDPSIDLSAALVFLTSLEVETPPTKGENHVLSLGTGEQQQEPSRIADTVISSCAPQQVDEITLLRQGLLDNRCFFSYCKFPAYVLSFARKPEVVNRRSNLSNNTKLPRNAASALSMNHVAASPLTCHAKLDKGDERKFRTQVFSALAAIRLRLPKHDKIDKITPETPSWQVGVPRKGTTAKSTKKRVHGISYAELLVPSKNRVDPEKPLLTYDPFFLDNPRFRQGKHHTVMRLEGLTISVIPFVKPKKLKDQLNEQFHELHPWIHHSMTLSKLRNLKADIFSLLDHLTALDPSSVASAWVYFERLVLQRVVEKSNRKLFCFACVLLAYKFNQPCQPNILKSLIQALQKLDRKENLSSSEMFAAEFQVFMLLGFSLQVSYSMHDLAEYIHVNVAKTRARSSSHQSIPGGEGPLL
eukprot:GHVQ01014493.1.p1 GENE.GHVQ01014493.1~~GHVQ01014493.1.p1  ORF type:complete len:420 (-),score=29.56 GHVQ01014493.1:2136-3395(-)